VVAFVREEQIDMVIVVEAVVCEMHDLAIGKAAAQVWCIGWEEQVSQEDQVGQGEQVLQEEQRVVTFHRLRNCRHQTFFCPSGKLSESVAG